MTFHGEPGLTVMTEKEIGNETVRVFLCRFNGKGVFHTDDTKVIRRLTPHFRHDKEGTNDEKK